MEHTNHKLAVSLVTIVAIGGLAAFVLTNSHEAHQGKRTAPLVPTVDVAAESPRAAKLAAARKAEREAAEARIEQRLAEADREGIAAAEQCLTGLRDLFRQARQGSRPFAEDALAFSSKWRLVADYLPFTPGNLHAEYLKEAFEQHLFSSHQLAQRLEAAITEFQRTQQDIENRALIDIGADLESLKLQTVPPPSQQQLQQRIHDVLEQSVRNVRDDLVADVVLAVVSGELAPQLVRTIAIRLGISSTVLGAGASASWATFGASAVVGLLVDWIITKIWDWWADPTGDLAAKIDRQVDQLRFELLDGPQGLKKTFVAAATTRSELRRKAIRFALKDWAE